MQVLPVSNQTSQWLRLAVKQAQMSSCVYRHGVVVLRGGRVVGTGFNIVQNDPALGLSTCTTHAEKVALRRASWDGTHLIVVRLRQDGSLAPSAPCVECAELIERAGINTIIYSVNNGIELVRTRDLRTVQHHSYANLSRCLVA